MNHATRAAERDIKRMQTNIDQLFIDFDLAEDNEQAESILSEMKSIQERIESATDLLG